MSSKESEKNCEDLLSLDPYRSRVNLQMRKNKIDASRREI